MEFEDDYDLLEPQKKGTKRFLTLTEKVEVIELYNTNQNIRLLVNKFQCGISQIKSILRHQEKYMNDWKNQADPTRAKRGTSEQMKYHRVVMYEWLRRCQCYPIKLTDQYIREKAVHATKVLKVTDFRINKEWIRRFKHTFKLNSDELLSNDTQYNKNKPRKSLNIEDIVNDETFKVEDLDLQAFKNNKSNRKRRKPIGSIIIKPNRVKQESSELNDMDVTIERKESSSEENLSSVLNVVGKEIQDYKEAVTFLEPLEEFALFKENVRAIGLVNQLENLFRDEIITNSSKAEEENLLAVLENPDTKDIQNFREAMIYLWPLEQFSLAKENIRAVALINLLENIFREEMLKAAKS